jgi:uncharacterized cupin superfamily protein
MTDSTRRHPNVVNVNELKGAVFTRGERFGFTNKVLGRAAAAQGIGCSWYEVPPGRTAFPNHFHCANEESLFILEGAGTLRIGGDSVAVGTGDYVALPPGPEHSHQLLNTGTSPLRYLCLSTQQRTEVVGYPDSNKIGAFGMPAGAGQQPFWLRGMFEEKSSVDYYTGEEEEE